MAALPNDAVYRPADRGDGSVAPRPRAALAPMALGTPPLGKQPRTKVGGASAGPLGGLTSTPGTPSGAIGQMQTLAANAPPRGAVPGGSMVTSNAPGTNPQNPVPVGKTPPQAMAPPMAPLGLGPGAQGTPTDPNNPLTMQTLARDNDVDRFQLAQDRFNTFTESTDPAYQAALRQATQMGAAMGGIGSGQLRTSLGDLGAQRDLNLRTSGQGFLQDALEGTIGDSFGDVGIAQQQQGFQNQQQQQAFQNELQRLGFSEDMLNSAFGRSLQQFQAGQMGGTGSGTTLAVGNQFTNQGNDALGALGQLMRNQGAAGAGVPGQTPPFNPTAQNVPWLGGGMNG